MKPMFINLSADTTPILYRLLFVIVE